VVEIATTEDHPQGVRTVLYVLLVFGLLMLGLGVFLIVSPHETLKVITVVIGICLLVDGVIALAAGAFGRGEARGTLALLGIITMVAGLVLVKKPFGALTLFVTILGIWFIVAGVTRFVHAFSFREGRGMYLLGALIDVVAGVVILSWKDITLSTLAIVVGIVLVVRGLMFSYACWRLLKLERSDEQLAAELPV
jgi:uncharacterized membrane protein HdeD (DUF308 family)